MADPFVFVEKTDGKCEVVSRGDRETFGWLTWDEDALAWRVTRERDAEAGPYAKTRRQGAIWLMEDARDG